MKEFLKAQWAKLAAECAMIFVFVLAYFAHRHRSNGELNFAAAKRELEINTARGAALESQLKVVHEKQVDVVSDILSEAINLSNQKALNETLSAEDVIARLRAHGLIAP